MIPELPKLVANGLDPLAKNSDRWVSLGDGAKLDVDHVYTSIAVVLEELLKRAQSSAAMASSSETRLNSLVEMHV
jgi:hypothetical protein